MIIQGATIQGTSIYDAQDLFPFSTFTFTPAGMIGATGPTIGNCYATYSNVGNTWLQNTDYFSVPIRGYQSWTVPATGTYEIEAAGSRSSINQYANNSYSFGATVRGRFNLRRGDKIALVVGQFAANTVTNGNFNGAGGGGGSFVVLGNVLTGGNTITMANATPLIVAGGGGGTGRWSSWQAGNIKLGSNGATTTSGVASNQGAAPGTNGWGGNSHVGANLVVSSNGFDSGGGGGLFNNGVNGVGGNTRTNATNGQTGGGGQGFANLAIGGVLSSTYVGQSTTGGFGGGGGGTPICGGGGGGYSGGGGAWANATTAADGGGGGGSFINANVVSVVATSTGTYEGNATFNGISISTVGFSTNIGYVRITRV
jgi:hypothetical protein